MITIDTSIFIDLLFEYDSSRTLKAEETLNIILERGLEIINPTVFKVELAGVLTRRMQIDRALEIIKDILSEVKLIPNPDDLAFEVALKTGSRATDAYFIATAKLTNSILITNDRIMSTNAKKYRRV
jgi:predicted nucleic acid-binding protein